MILLKKINKKKIGVCLVILIVILVAVFTILFLLSEKEMVSEIGEIQANYYVVQQNDQYGVIDLRRE